MHMAKVLLDLPYRASRYSKQRVSLNFKFSYVKKCVQISAFLFHYFIANLTPQKPLTFMLSYSLSSSYPPL